jgi:hypothetical protein
MAPDDSCELATLLGYGPVRLVHVRTGMVMKLQRILALVLLCVGLLVAGAPAIPSCAKGTPTHDCCPNKSQPVCRRSYEIGSHSGIQSCCAAGTQTVAIAASDVTPTETDAQPTPADPPLSITFLTALSASYFSARLGVTFATPSIFRSLTPLYLRTGRLRL